MTGRFLLGMLCVLFLCCFLAACAARQVDLSQLDYATPVPPPLKTEVPPPPPPKTGTPVPKVSKPKGPPSLATRERIITENEILKLGESDMRLTTYVCQTVLARINKKDRLYIVEDIKKKRPLRVPVDFTAYLNWSPLPKNLPGNIEVPKLIWVVKDIPFTGWYENGRMKGDALTCVGKQWGWTQSGIYKVLDKGEDKYSNLYNNAYGEPAWMPFALRIYGAVWIHAGDVVGPYCSHGCINLSPDPAEKLFRWATIGTTVVVSDSMGDLNRFLSTLCRAGPKDHVICGPSSE